MTNELFWDEIYICLDCLKVGENISPDRERSADTGNPFMGLLSPYVAFKSSDCDEGRNSNYPCEGCGTQIFGLRFYCDLGVTS